MINKKSQKVVFAGIFAAVFAFSSAAEAGNLLSFGDPRSSRISLFEQAAAWLTGFWSGVESTFQASSETPAGPTTSSCTDANACGSADSDAGITIDPEG